MKHKSPLIAGVCLAALALCLSSAASARTKKTEAPSPAPAASATASPAASAAPAKERAFPFKGMISAVDVKAKTFTLTGKEKSRTFVMTDKTIFSKAGMPATMNDVAANEEARGNYWKRADGTLEVRLVKLGPLTAQEKAAQDARRAKRAQKKEKRAAAEATPETSPSPGQ